MRGKFEYGFLSGFVSSPGDSTMMKNRANMDIGAKVAQSTAIVGTTNDYCGSFIYQDGQLQTILTNEDGELMEKLSFAPWRFGFYISTIR